MSVVNYGEDYEYAGTRLSNSLVRTLEGLPYYVKIVFEDTGNTRGFFTMTGKNSDVPLKDLDLSPVKLGNVNKGDLSGFCCRKPARFYKQGLTGNVITCTKFMVGIHSKYLSNTIMGKYPTVKQIAELLLNGEIRSAAFSRDFSLSKGNKISLCYRDRKVGIAEWNYKASNFNYHLDEKYKFLQETLEESTNV